MNEEIWKPLDGWEGLYEVSNTGKIASISRIRGRLVKREVSQQRQILKPFVNTGDYLRVTLRRQPGSLSKPKVYLHRAVMIAFGGPSPEGKENVNHIDSNRSNNAIWNLEWVSDLENQRHAVKCGHIQFGESHHRTKLTQADVDYMRSMAKRGNKKILAKQFGIGFSTVCRIVNFKSWASESASYRQTNPEVSGQ